MTKGPLQSIACVAIDKMHRPAIFGALSHTSGEDTIHPYLSIGVFWNNL